MMIAFPLSHLKSGTESICRRNWWQCHRCWWFFFFVRLKIQRYCFSASGENVNNVWPETRTHTKTSCLSMCGVSNISRTWSRWQNGNTASGSHDDDGNYDDEDFDAQSLCFPLHISYMSNSCIFSPPLDCTSISDSPYRW